MFEKPQGNDMTPNLVDSTTMKFYKNLLDPFRSFLDRVPLLDRYLILQLIPPFLFSVGLFASLGVCIGNLSDLANKVVEYDLPILDAVKILLLKVPEFTAYSLPVSILLTTLMTYGRLSSDSELIALRSCGASLYRIISPALILSLMITGLTFLFNECIVPEANYRATEILVTSINEEHEFWQTKDIFYPDYEKIILPNGQKLQQLRSLFYAEHFDGETMKSLTILQWLGQQLNQIVISDSAQWNPAENTWDFFNGTLYLLSADESYQKAIPFKHQQISLPKEVFEFASQGRNPYEMNIFQARKYKKILKLSGNEQKVRLFEVRIEQKIAFPFICLVFGMIGAVLGCSPQHSGRGKSFGLSVGIVFIYYILNFVSGSLGIMGALSPFLAAWFPNLFGLGLGGWLAKNYNG